MEKIRMAKLKKLMKKFSKKEKSNVSGNVVELNQDNFYKFIHENENSVVDFYADWCGPCKLISPIISEVSLEYSGRVAFGKLNVDKNENIAVEFAISAIPALLFFKKGNLVDSLIGAYPKHEIKQWIERNI